MSGLSITKETQTHTVEAELVEVKCTFNLVQGYTSTGTSAPEKSDCGYSVLAWGCRATRDGSIWI